MTDSMRPEQVCSPRERGCPGERAGHLPCAVVLPARAGVSRHRPNFGPTLRRAPRASGGVPPCTARTLPSSWCSPRERGCPAGDGGLGYAEVVLPARAGVSRRRNLRLALRYRAPRASGGVPISGIGQQILGLCSPRERGCPAARPRRTRPGPVLPARAGVSRPEGGTGFRAGCAPRASGGVPRQRQTCGRGSRCSPRERGCPVDGRRGWQREEVLPARAGVSRLAWRRCARASSAPRASGGVPSLPSTSVVSAPCSPRERGCPDGQGLGGGAGGVLPARAGVSRRSAPTSFSRAGAPRASGVSRSWWTSTGARCRAPRASGGVPNTYPDVALQLACSPRERGCPGRGPDLGAAAPVLPARAGVSRRGTGTTRARGGAPRASGGVPSSDRQPCCTAFVLPARAGVSRAWAYFGGRTPGAPRASGGVPMTRTLITMRYACSPRERGCPVQVSGLHRAGVVLPARAGVSR